jgi:hypothetical protein
MSNTIRPTVFYRTLNVEGLEIFYREVGRWPTFTGETGERKPPVSLQKPQGWGTVLFR